MAFSLADYEILAEIGRGAYGTVLKAKQKSLGRVVAIKCLMPQHAQAESDILRFRREAEALASLSHDNILSVIDYAYSGGNYCIVMEYVDGIAFDQLLATRLHTNECLFVLWKVIEALRCAHAAGIIHRDVKPANILLGSQGKVKLADFGLALSQQNTERLSLTNATVGTIAYLAPEALVSPRDADARVDIYALGCILYEILAGVVPFKGVSLAEVSALVLNTEPVPIACDARCKSLADLALACLCKERDHRPGLDAIALQVTTFLEGQQYHLSRELGTLIASLQAGTPVKTGLLPNLPQSAIPSHKLKMPLKWNLLLAGAIIILSIIIALILQNSQPAPLPALPPGLDTMLNATDGEPNAR